jgi:hypothetical protein
MKRALVLAILFWAIPLQEASAQVELYKAKIRFGALDTTSYPSPSHPTEWSQELVAELYDASGNFVPPSSSRQYTWGLDFCNGNGMQFGWASGLGVFTIRPDGNKIKNVPGCCQECPFQSYIVAVRISIEDTYVQSTSVRVPNIVIPSEHHLSASYPNPFSLGTRIRYDIKEPAHVSLVVFDLLGRKVEELVNDNMIQGAYTRLWQPLNAPGGVYFYRLVVTPGRGNQITFLEKIILLR